MTMRFRAALVAACCFPAAALAQAPSSATSPAERPTDIAGIDGVIADDAEWTLAWQGPETADGAIAADDGALLFAQEQTSTVIRLGADDVATTFLWETGRAGALAGDTMGRIYAVQRTCTDPGLPGRENCTVPTAVVALDPQRRWIADAFADGRGLGRLNDLTVRGDGTVYFTVGGAYRAAPNSAPSTVSAVVEGEGVHTNGIILSPDESVLYVTNGPEVLAFDVAPDGSTSGQRVFAALDAGDSGDGMAVDSEGRLYVTGVGLGVNLYVFDAAGERLGVIPTPRQPVSVAFAGLERETLYLTAMGATDADGGEHSVPQGARNTAMSVYRVPMLARGFAGRAK